MFCPACGSRNTDGAKFCVNCGGRMIGQQAAGTTPAGQPPAAAPEKGGGGWLRSPAGIVLAVLIGIVVLGGIAAGVVLVVKLTGTSSEEKLAEVWRQYDEIASDSARAQAKITLDTAVLEQAKADLDEAQKKAADLKKSLAGTGVSAREPRYVQLDKTIDTFDRYSGASAGLYSTLADAVANQTLADNQAAIDDRVREIQDLLNELKDLMDEFLADNEAVKTRPGFKPESVIVTVDGLAAESGKAAAAEAQVKEERPYQEAAGKYVNADGATITLNPDRSAYSVHADGGSSAGTFVLSGNTITFYSEGITDVGTLENGVISAPDGRRWVKQ